MFITEELVIWHQATFANSWCPGNAFSVVFHFQFGRFFMYKPPFNHHFQDIFLARGTRRVVIVLLATFW